MYRLGENVEFGKLLRPSWEFLFLEGNSALPIKKNAQEMKGIRPISREISLHFFQQWSCKRFGWVSVCIFVYLVFTESSWYFAQMRSEIWYAVAPVIDHIYMSHISHKVWAEGFLVQILTWPVIAKLLLFYEIACIYILMIQITFFKIHRGPRTTSVACCHSTWMMQIDTWPWSHTFI